MSAKTYIRQRRASLSLLISLHLVDSLVLLPTHRQPLLPLFARRKKNRDDEDDINRWYDDVDADATPTEVFWEEMERQRSLADTTDFPQQQEATPKQPDKGVDASLSEYAAYMVKDNWLDEDLVMMMEEDGKFQDVSVEEQNRAIDEEYRALQQGIQDEADDNAWMTSDEPWDRWNKDPNEEESQEFPQDDSEFLFTDDDDDGEEAARLEAEHLQRISKLKIKSRRLENARNNPKAAAFFARGPDEVEGFDRMWVSAIDNVCFKNLVGVFRDYGVQFADNFGDWQDGCIEDGIDFTIEDVASFKAREVFKVTGLPCIASRTSFEVEPVPTGLSSTPAGAGRATSNANTMVVSGYRFNDIGMHVDYIIEALKSVSEDTRVTRFRTCLCYYDGELEVFDYGVLDCDLYYANSIRTFIPVAAAINEMCETMQLTFGLEFQKWLNQRVTASLHGNGAASAKLRDRVLKEGKVLPNDIIDVSAFMDSSVDVNLMDDCAKELANKFMDMKPTKILTVATTGLVIALPMAKYLQVPVVYARKERNIVMADTYKASYSSKTVGKNRELLVSKSHLDKDDRILVVDDFLSSGSSQEALLRIISDSGATAVGAGVLLEKAYDAGRQALSGFNIPVHSLCRVASVKSGVIQLEEEEGFDRM